MCEFGGENGVKAKEFRANVPIEWASLVGTVIPGCGRPGTRPGLPVRLPSNGLCRPSERSTRAGNCQRFRRRGAVGLAVVAGLDPGARRGLPRPSRDRRRPCGSARPFAISRLAIRQSSKRMRCAWRCVVEFRPGGRRRPLSAPRRSPRDPARCRKHALGVGRPPAGCR
jgi:hypothetical protein